jgi:FkbM family methyltransferase
MDEPVQRDAVYPSAFIRTKHALAALVTKHWPTLCYYHASLEARQKLRVRRHGDSLEIIDEGNKRLIRISAANAVHVRDMVESFEYYFGSTAPTELRRGADLYQLADFSRPALHKVTGFDDFPVMCPSTTEPFSTTHQYLDFARLKPGATVLDLGAYSGLTTIAFSKAVGSTGRVIALEPDPINFRSAEHNLAAHRRINDLNNVTLLPFAAGATDDPIELSSEGSMGSALISIVGSYRGARIEVEARTLMSLAREQELERVDFVKVDIEGAELFVIPASTEFLNKFRPKIVIEGHPVNGTSTVQPLVEFLESLGYRTHIEAQQGLPLCLIQAFP